MPCYTPRKAYLGPGGRPYFTEREGDDRPIQLPCGSCIGCRGRRAEDWTVRCVHELEVPPPGYAQVGSFVTLTYSDAHLPEDGGLQVRDLQLLWKRLRNEGLKFRYFACGEYGETNFRPHYHAIVFGVDFNQSQAALQEAWGKGFVSVGKASYASAKYVAKYAVKSSGAARAWVNPRTGEFVRRPFLTMSRKPGIGSAWFARYKGDVFPSDEVVLDGKTYRPPRFYDERLSDSEFDSVKAKRLQVMSDYPFLETTSLRLRVKEEVTTSRVSLIRRSL